MKRLALLAALIIGSAASSFAQLATITLNNYDNNLAIWLQGLTGDAFIAPADTILTLTGNGQKVVNTLDKSTTIAMGEPGFFDVGVGTIPGAAANATVNFTLTAVYKGETYGLTGLNNSWSQATGSWNDAAVPPAPATGPAFGIGITGGKITLTSVPEPSTIALGLLGAAALLIRRRK